MQNHRQLAEHARLEHADSEDDFIVDVVTFSDTHQFKDWKMACEEKHVISRFASNVHHSTNSKTTYLRCHSALRTPSSVAAKTKKTVPYCTAYMNVTEGVNGISVEHCLTHCGHEVRPSQLKLDDNAERYIISLLMEGLTVRQVHKRLRLKMRSGPRTRLYFTTTRDIRNIARKCRVQPGRLHALDTVSVQMRVDNNLESDGIQYFRPANDASGDGFTLVVMNPTQREWLRKYGQRALCLDDTFNLTSYSLRLATIVVADEWDRALPAAYLLSYRMTEAEVGIMFETVKEFLPSFHTDFFMTDDTNTFWNGFKRVFSPTWTKRLLCLWHVQRAMKKNAASKLVNVCAQRNLLEPFVKKIREICLLRDRQLFTTKYTSLLTYLHDNGEAALASYLENSWSDRTDQWAAFGRLGSCVSTSMLCERFHKTLKHDILEGKANVRIDSLLQLLINLTAEMEEERNIMMERGVEEGRYRLQQHHRSHAAAVKKYSSNQHLIAAVGIGLWKVKENGNIYHIQEHYCPCNEKNNNHFLRGECRACPYAFACNCTMDVKSGISCLHIHAALLYASSGRRTMSLYAGDELTADVLTVEDAPSTEDQEHNSDGEDLMEVEVVIEDDEPVNDYAAGRVCSLAVLNKADDNVSKALEKASYYMEEFRKLMAAVDNEVNGKENSQQLARRPDIPITGRPQGLTPIRKLHKRSHLRKAEQAKRKKVEGIPDYETDRRDACSVCLRKDPLTNTGSSQVFWIQCPKCENWMHTDCVDKTCPRDETLLETNG
ncbi:hypothetical protein OESDEN_14513 [Oesophagostomum dentatum]|uniref:Uncharacterized protein n=1 Tax=Oesophagostomum dentatum TaxID=61180 RepID=A0A0B1SQG0_OESDE|nr:hypothetical protein OESDEN_14513 [Oesophagostomum dentatum]